MDKRQVEYQAIPFPRARAIVVDILHYAKSKHMIHGFIELDVTKARQLIRDHKARTGESLSFTAFLIYCLGRAVEENKMVHACRDWRNRLILFDEVDVNTLVEGFIQGRKMGTAHIIRAVNKRSYRQIHQEIRSAQANPIQLREHKAWVAYVYLPRFVRLWFWRLLARSPWRWKETVGTVTVTAVGMFGEGGGWGMAMPFHPLSLTVGGISRKLVLVDGQVAPHEFLHLTLSFDHDIVDGAPAARFAQRYKELVEAAYGLAEVVETPERATLEDVSVVKEG